MQNNQKKGFDNNPYINQSQGINNMTQTNQNPYYNKSQMDNQINKQIPTQQPSTMNSLFGSFDTENFIKGALIGAVGAYLLTNENAQKTIFKTVAKAGDMFGAGMEEIKERMEDAKAELEAEKEANA